MALCPNCGTTLKEEYGMSQCSKCGVFSFVDMDGNAVIASADDEDKTPVVPPETSTTAKIPLVPPPGAVKEEPAFEFEPVSFEIPENESENDERPTPLASDFGGGGDFATPAVELDIVPPENPGEQNFEPFSFDPVPDASPSEMAIPDLGPADDPLGLADFANSELSSAKDGPLLFRVVVSGIDSKEMRETIREVLEDPRFGWDADQMFAKLEKGVLKIERLSPVKASILVTKIKRLPVKIRWEQYAISQVDSTQ